MNEMVINFLMEEEGRYFLHCQKTEDGVELFLPLFRVEAVGDALMEWFSERAFQDSKNGQLAASKDYNFCIKSNRRNNMRLPAVLREGHW